jgi:hypothetical protein
MTVSTWIATRRRQWERRLARLADLLTAAKPDQPGDNTSPTQEKRQ